MRLEPIRNPDGTPIRYGVRDPIGVEALGADPIQGINRGAEWLARSGEVFGAEHDEETGEHQVLTIPRAVLAFSGHAIFTGGLPDPGSYFYGRPVDDLQVTFSRFGAGLYAVSWPTLGAAPKGAAGGQPGVVLHSLSASAVSVEVFDPSTGALGDGDFTILLWD